MMKYITLFPDMLTDHFEDLTDEEIGQIVRAALVYAQDGTEPEYERRSVLALTWKRIRAHLDQCAAKIETLTANGSKGGRPKNQTKPTETNENQEKPNETKNNHEQEQAHAHEQEQEQEQEQYTTAPARASDRARPDGEPAVRVIGIDGSDLTQAEKDCEEAERLVARYMPASRSPLGIDPRVGAISEMISRHGAEAVGRAFREAVASDNRGGVSVAFVRAILENCGGRQRAAPDTGYQKRHYTAEDYRGMETDLSAELAELKAARAG